MRTRTTKHYSLRVLRSGTLIEYNAERYPSRADARVDAKRLGEYAEIWTVETTVKEACAERIEA